MQLVIDSMSQQISGLERENQHLYSIFAYLTKQEKSKIKKHVARNRKFISESRIALKILIAAKPSA